MRWREQARTARLELAIAARLGATPIEALRLIVTSLRFHLGNWYPSLASRMELALRLRLHGRRVHSHLRVSGGDLAALYDVLGYHAYRPPAGVLSSAPRTILDLGANVGLASLYFQTLFPDARIICVEPYPDTFRLLCLTRDANAWGWTCLEAAAGPATGRGLLLVARQHTIHFLTDGPHPDFPTLPVRVLTVPDIMTRAGVDQVDLLKCDIEGGEEALFCDGDPSWLIRVQAVAMEMHYWINRQRVIRSLADHGLVEAGRGHGAVIFFRRC